MHISWIICWILIVTVSYYGCTTTETMSPEHFFFDTSRNIKVFTRDGRVIRFKSGDYTVTDAEHGTLSGRGRILIDERRNEWREFEGSIGFPEIKNITHTEQSAAGTIVAATFLGLGAILLILLLFPPTVRFD